jgi:hypothetical protein
MQNFRMRMNSIHERTESLPVQESPLNEKYRDEESLRLRARLNSRRSSTVLALKFGVGQLDRQACRVGVVAFGPSLRHKPG